MQLLQNECQESTEQKQQQKQVNMTQEQQQQPSPQHKMDKFHPPKPKINAFNDLLTCFLCRGYMINPTTIDVCMHTYCRSCVVRHLRVDCCCPQCGKATTTTNLVCDESLRSIIFKLVPGLYQKERECVEKFISKAKSDRDLDETTVQALSASLQINDHLFSPADPISLSLEFHPTLAEQCSKGSVPPVRYLQCPASVKVQHLKRFICSKFAIDPSNRKLGIEIIYEDEILPSDFTLMDIAYSYNWQRHAPLDLKYRILIYNEDLALKSDCGYVSDDKVSEKSYKQDLEKSNPAASFNQTFLSEAERNPGSVNNGKVETQTSPFPSQPSKSKPAKPASTKLTSFHAASSNPEVPVKVTISRKPSESKKSVSKKSSTADDFVIPTTTNDFKSLRSNDIRFSDYAITLSTTNTIEASTHTSIAKTLVQPAKKDKPVAIKEEKSAKCDIVVSIPHNQMHDKWDTKPLAHLKTASKKSPNSTATEAAIAPTPAKKVRNVPKLKIELNSLKTKLIEKPKSADIRLDTLMIKHHRPRKFSLDEPQPVVGKVDLETYVRNIGLKPIEVHTTGKLEATDKYTPNASPMSSCSSTTSSSTSNFNFNCSTDITSSSSSSHKKRKKKHSKDSRESKDSKRKKMHAEISSHSAEESLKMKVKLTPSISLKSLKLDSRKPSSFCFDRTSDQLDFEKSKVLNSKIERQLLEAPKSHEDHQLHERSKEKLKSRSSETKKSKPTESNNFIPDVKKQRDLEKPKPLEIQTVLSESVSKSSATDFDDDEDLVIPDSTTLGLSKSLSTIRETNLPQSPPLPPSLFKTTPLTFSTFSANVANATKQKHVALPKDKPKTSHMKPIAPKPTVAKPGQQSSLSPISSLKTPKFVVPNPPRFMTPNTTKFLSTPTSIASAANKHMGNLLKRSISLDETRNTGPTNKQLRVDKPNQITVSAYGSNLHMTKVEIPATPTSSTAKATYEIPLYSPLSASYNPKCSFSVNSTTSAAKSTKSLLPTPTTSTATRVKQTFAENALATNKTDVDVKKTTSNDIKPSTDTTSPTTAKTVVAVTNKIPTTSMTTLMGPPLPMQKLNSSLAVVPATVVPTQPQSTLLPFNSPSTLNATSTAQPMPVLSTAYLSSPLSMVNYRQSKVLLAHAKPTNLSEMKVEKQTSTAAAAATTTTATGIKTSATTTNGLATEKPKSSLRQFRLPSRESGQDILDLSASTKSPLNGVAENPPSKPSGPLTHTSHGSSLEMALNKIKQNMSTTTTTSTSVANTTSSNILDNGIQKQELLSPISDDLQNLHLLSESATAREKIAISTGTTLSSAPTSLYEKAKITQNSLVRQQNASVRNIPNPSALAFRNQQPVTSIPPMVTIAAGLATTLTSVDKSLLLKTPSPPKSPHSPNCSTSSTSPSRIVTKKHASIDQVAASLNQRASAAAEASAKANSKLADESLLVSSTSSSLADKLETKEIKQESAELQSDTVVAQASSTANTCPLVSVLDIKKEPEEKPEETVSEIKAPLFINAPTKKTTMVENLVTSVINVTTPTSTLLTATSAAGF